MDFKLKEQLQEQYAHSLVWREQNKSLEFNVLAKEKVLPKTIILTYVDDASNPSTHGFKLFQSVKLVC